MNILPWFHVWLNLASRNVPCTKEISDIFPLFLLHGCYSTNRTGSPRKLLSGAQFSRNFWCWNSVDLFQIVSFHATDISLKKKVHEFLEKCPRVYKDSFEYYPYSYWVKGHGSFTVGHMQHFLYTFIGFNLSCTGTLCSLIALKSPSHLTPYWSF